MIVDRFDHQDDAVAERVHDLYAELRKEGPVGWSHEHDGFWVLSGYEAIFDCARDPQRFSSKHVGIPDPFGDLGGLPPITLDPPEHTTYRNLLQGWFSPKQLLEYEGAVRDIAVRLLTTMSSPAEIVREFARPLASEVMARVSGVPDEDLEPFNANVITTVEHLGDIAVAAPAAIASRLYLRDELVPRRRAEPGDDLISHLLAARVDGEPLSDDMIAGLTHNVIGAGVDTTSKVLSTSIAFFAEHPEEQASARRATDLSLAIEELLRLFAPISAGRVVTTATSFADHEMQQGDRVLLLYASANRDDTEFPDGGAADLTRHPNRHMAFGVGIHRCLGMHLARLELRVAYEELLARTSSFELAGPVTYSHGHLWGATHVPLAFER